MNEKCNTQPIPGMKSCQVCGRDFPLIIENHYIGREPNREGFAAIAGGMEPNMWDVIDCPHCGSQNRLQPRMRIVDIFGRSLPFQDDEEDSEKDQEDND